MKFTPARDMSHPRAETQEDFAALLEERGLATEDVAATIYSAEWDPEATGETGVNMTGFSAYVRDKRFGDDVFASNGFETRDGLVAILNALGIQFEEHAA